MIELVPMKLCHVPQVAQLETVCFSDPWSERSIASELTNPLSTWLVATEDDRVVGYVGAQSVPPEADMMNLAVSIDDRRKGIAQLLVCALIEKLRADGISSLALEVRASNRAAIALYEKLGFATVGCRPRYYTNPKEDAYILRKEWEV